MGNPRTNSTSRNASIQRSADASNLHFVENSASLPVQDFIDEYVAPYKQDGARVVDFRYNSGESTRVAGKQKVSFLTVRMPQMRINPTSKSVEPNDKITEEGEVITAPMVDVKIFASKQANEILLKNKKDNKGLEGICVSPFYDTIAETGEETGLASFTLSVESGESADLNALGLRF